MPNCVSESWSASPAALSHSLLLHHLHLPFTVKVGHSIVSRRACRSTPHCFLIVRGAAAQISQAPNQPCSMTPLYAPPRTSFLPAAAAPDSLPTTARNCSSQQGFDLGINAAGINNLLAMASSNGIHSLSPPPTPHPYHAQPPPPPPQQQHPKAAMDNLKVLGLLWPHMVTAKGTVEDVTKSPRWFEYAGELTPLADFLDDLLRAGIHQSFNHVNFLNLRRREITFPGKNKARVVSDPDDNEHVFKGFDFAAFLAHGPDFHAHQRDTMLQEIRALAALPAHPNIMPCPSTLVVVTDAAGTDRICGFLQPVMARGTLDDQVIKANRSGSRVPLHQRAKWSHGLARAVLHTHRVGRTFHMDVKPGNTLIDDTDEIRLIDWEQSGVSMFTHSKEVTIDQAAREVGEPDERGRRRIVYTPHEGPKRKNLPWGYPDYNVFPDWKATCPRAAELAEVFSIGRVQWMFFEQREQNPGPTEWTGRSSDIPKEWIDMANRCMAVDPNDRPELDELVDYWAAEAEKYAPRGANGAAGHAKPVMFGK